MPGVRVDASLVTSSRATPRLSRVCRRQGLGVVSWDRPLEKSSFFSSHVSPRDVRAAVGGDLADEKYPGEVPKQRAFLSSETWDVVIIGGGIIGLYTAHELLNAGCKVAVVEKYSSLCSGATGAGQGYIWMCHRDPLAVGAWSMAMQSKERWKDLLSSWQGLYSNESSPTLFDRNGSLLVAHTTEEHTALESRAALLEKQGLCPLYLASREDLEREEPALKHALVDIKSGVVVNTDAQIDGRLTMEILFGKCASYGDRFGCLFGTAVQGLRSTVEAQDLFVTGVSLANGKILESNAVVVCAGAWSGDLVSSWVGEYAEQSRQIWSDAIVPRRGHLLVVKTSKHDKPIGRRLRHGIMESSYSKHYSASLAKSYDITFTATENILDNTLMIGSSRELPKDEKWNQDINPTCRDDILNVARMYLPEMLKDATILETRVGLRPYSLGHRDHRPYIGPIPDVNGLFIAAGHEGSGLTLAPSTADLIMYHLADKGYITIPATRDINNDILSYTRMFDDWS